MDPHPTYRLYSELSWLWPLWSDPDGEYARWCGQVAGLIERHSRIHARTLLNLGCGGGKNACNLKRRFAVTGVDLSPDMLALARGLNPDCEFIQADMRTFAAAAPFDCVLVDDAITHMTSRADLAAVFKCAHANLKPGGVMVVAPDATTESFVQNSTRVSTACGRLKPNGLDVTFIENNYDPDPGDETYEGLMVYLIRRDGRLTVETDCAALGLFPLDAWRRGISDAGFLLNEHTLETDRGACPVFAGVRPG